MGTISALMRQASSRNHRGNDRIACATRLPRNYRGLSRRQRRSARSWSRLGVVGRYGYLQLSGPSRGHSDVSSQSRKGLARYTPTPAEWAALTIQPVIEKPFRAEHVTEGKVAIDEERSTPVFSPYAGRVTKLLVRAGRWRHQGPAAVHHRSRRHRAGAERLHHGDDRDEQGAVGARPRRDPEQARHRSVRRQGGAAEGCSAGRSQPGPGAKRRALVADGAGRLGQQAASILGFNEQTIDAFRQKGGINPEVTIFAPISGTVVQRKMGPASMSAPAPADPVYVIGDLSTVWLTAFVRETDAAVVAVGQEIGFTVLALPGRPLFARINYVADRDRSR